MTVHKIGFYKHDLTFITTISYFKKLKWLWETKFNLHKVLWLVHGWPGVETHPKMLCSLPPLPTPSVPEYACSLIPPGQLNSGATVWGQYRFLCNNTYTIDIGSVYCGYVIWYIYQRLLFQSKWYWHMTFLCLCNLMRTNVQSEPHAFFLLLR